SRDIMIVTAVILSWLVDKPVALKPLLVSKLNTVAQIALACVIMAARRFDFDAGIAVMVLTALVAALTLLSIAFYVADWARHMNAAETGPCPLFGDDPMTYGRYLTFWVATFLALAALLWLLHDMLLPFVAGIALAYVLAPLADRVERLGVNRTIAALLIVGLLVVALIALILLLVPLLLQQGAALIAHIPGYFKRIKELIVDPNFPWLNWLGSAETGKTASDLVGQVATWLMSFSYSLWTGGKALVSFASVLIVMPVVTFYLIRDWHAMIDRVYSWVPVRQRGPVRQLAREIDAAIGGFLRGQFGVCIVLGCYYAIALMLV